MTMGKITYLGSYKTLEEAISVRKKAEIEQGEELSHVWKGNLHL